MIGGKKTKGGEERNCEWIKRNIEKRTSNLLLETMYDIINQVDSTNTVSQLMCVSVTVIKTEKLQQNKIHQTIFQYADIFYAAGKFHMLLALFSFVFIAITLLLRFIVQCVFICCLFINWIELQCVPNNNNNNYGSSKNSSTNRSDISVECRLLRLGQSILNE